MNTLKKLPLLACAGLVWASAAGCATTERFTLVAVRNFDPHSFNTAPAPAVPEAKRTNDSFIMLGWTTGVVPPFGEPIEKALIAFGGPKAHGCSLQLNNLDTLYNLDPRTTTYRDVQIDQFAWSVFVAGWASIKVRGTPVQFTQFAAEPTQLGSAEK